MAPVRSAGCGSVLALIQAQVGIQHEVCRRPRVSPHPCAFMGIPTDVFLWLPTCCHGLVVIIGEQPSTFASVPPALEPSILRPHATKGVRTHERRRCPPAVELNALVEDFVHRMAAMYC